MINFTKYDSLLLLTKLNDFDTYLTIIILTHSALTKINRFPLINLKLIIIIININTKYAFNQGHEFLIKRRFILRSLSKTSLKLI